MATLSPDEWHRLTPDQKCYLVGTALKKRWHKLARPEQIPFKKKSCKVSLFTAGRGTGKTRGAAEFVLSECLQYPGLKVALIAPTYAHGVQTCLFGQSGICGLMPGDWHDYATWQEKKYMLTFTNGSQVRVYSSEHPKDIRGPEFHLAWVDEIADLAHGMEVWKILFPAVRLKREDEVPSRIYATGTPRAVELMLHLMDKAEDEDSNYELNHGRTVDNINNLDRSTVEELQNEWEGTRYYLQEMEGILLREAENALWTQDTISSCRREFKEILFDTIAIGVDPAVSKDKKADHTGIIVGGKHEGKVYILGDYSLRASALEWARLLVRIAAKHGASTIIYEKNLAGPLMKEVMSKTLDEMDSTIRLVPVHAGVSKQNRAEPVAALYEAGKVLHMPDRTDASASLDKLEAQMTQWNPTERDSPDRIDALVHLVKHLMFKDGKFNIFRASDVPWRGSR